MRCDVTPFGDDHVMAPTAVTSIEFAATARLLARAARHAGVRAPGFRSPPGLVGVHRTIRRRQGTSVIAVRIAGRPWAAVQADMIEGVVVANGLVSPEADRIRNAMWGAIADAPVLERGVRSHAA